MQVHRRTLLRGLGSLAAAGGLASLMSDGEPSAPAWASAGGKGARDARGAGEAGEVRDSARGLAPASALPDEDKARDAAGAADAAAWFADLPVGEQVAVAAATWPLDAPAPALAVRAVVDGFPQPWRTLGVACDEPDEPATAAGTDAVMLLGAQRVQLAAFGPGAESVTLRLYEAPDPGPVRSGAEASEVELLAANPAAERARPRIRTRAEWGAAPRRGKATYGRVRGVLVHHTETTNGYSAASVPAQLRAVQAFHMRGRGWQDIAYNVLVDRYGTAWEGRGGGLIAGVVGAHSYGVTNEVSVGLALLGNFQTAAAPAGMLATAEQVIAWKFLVHGVDPTSTFVGTSGRLQAISGHRDDRSTSCPGRNVSVRMGTIRSGVRDRMDAARRSAAPTVRVTGVLDGATVRALQRWLGVRTDGLWGPATSRALQARIGARLTGARDAQTTRRLQSILGVRADGVRGRATTSALQRYLPGR